MKYFEIKDKIIELMEERNLKPGMRLPPFRALAAELGTCVPTIQRAVGQLTKEGILYSKVGSGTYISAPKRANSGAMVGILIPYSMGVFSSDFISENLDAIRSTLMQHEYVPVTVSPPPGSIGKERGQAEISLIQQLLKYGISGLLVDSIAPAEDQFWTFLEKLEIPIVLFNNIGANYSRFDSVTSDNYRGGLLAGQHLISAGRKKCAFFTSNDNTTVEYERCKGFIDAFKQAGLLEPVIIYENTAGKIFEYGFDGVATLNDNSAATIIKSAKKYGLDVPKDISVIGFDNSEICTKITPNIDSIEQQTKLMGHRAAELIIKRLSHPNTREKVSLRLDVALFKRDSVF